MQKSKKPILFTKEGLQKKQSELKALQERRVGAVQELQFAREQGDRSENGAYKAARWKLSGIDSQIRRLHAMLRNVQVVEKRTDTTIGLGSIVSVNWNGTDRQFTIVGQEESDIESGSLSVVSPVGRALMGKTEGDEIRVSVPAGTQVILVKTVT